MITDNRREQIVTALAQRHFMSLDDVRSIFGCSPTTARRDLAALAATGRLRRTRGGAVAINAHAAANATMEIQTAEQSTAQADPCAAVKRRIGRAAATLIADGDTVALSGGTTVMEVARQLDKRKIGVVTNAVDVALELINTPGVRVMLLGGTLSSASREVVGPQAAEMLAAISIEILFASVDGLSAEAGATCIGTLEAQVLRAMAAQARRVVIVADHRKIGRAALARVLPLASISTLVTDACPTPALEAIRGAGVQIIEA